MVDWTYYPLTTLPGRYDIVLCRHPEDGKVNPGPKARPALVRTTAVSDDTGGGEVEVVYGTKVLKLRQRPFDLHVANLAEMDRAGLFHPTRFDLDMRIWLPWAEEFFVVPKGKISPVLGSLSPYMIRKLQEQYSYKQHLYAKVLAEMEQEEQKEREKGAEPRVADSGSQGGYPESNELPPTDDL